MEQMDVDKADKESELRSLKRENANLEERNLALNEAIGKQIYDIHEHEMTIKVLWKKVFELQRTLDNLRARNEELVEMAEARE